MECSFAIFAGFTPRLAFLFYWLARPNVVYAPSMPSNSTLAALAGAPILIATKSPVMQAHRTNW